MRRAVAATLSPRSSAAFAQSWPNPLDVPVMNQTFSVMRLSNARRASHSRSGSFKPVSRATLDKDPRDVASMFDAVARRYDITNTVLSLGQDRLGGGPPARRCVGPGERCSTWPPGRRCRRSNWPSPGRGASPRTSRSACCAPGSRGRCPRSAPTRPAAVRRRGVRRGDHQLRPAQRVDHAAGLREMARVTRRAAGWWCASSPPHVPVFATVYKEYLMRALPRVATRGVEQPRRLRLSGRVHPAWPDQADLARRIGRRLVAGALAQPHRRHRRAARRHQALTTATLAR